MARKNLISIDKANPLAVLLSAAVMLRYSFDLALEADCIENSVNHALDEGRRTADSARNVSDQAFSCTEMTAEVLKVISPVSG